MQNWTAKAFVYKKAAVRSWVTSVQSAMAHGWLYFKHITASALNISRMQTKLEKPLCSGRFNKKLSKRFSRLCFDVLATIDKIVKIQDIALL